MLAIVRSATLLGVRGTPVRVEVHVSGGVPGFTIVGLPDTSCREARDRVRAALLSCRLKWPDQRTTVNLAPSGVRKVGAGLDLAIAVGVLVATGQVDSSALDLAYVGELGLDGSIRPVTGMVPLAAALERTELVVAEPNAAEAGLVGGHTVRSARTLAEVVACLTGAEPWSRPSPPRAVESAPPPDLRDVRGNRAARAALEVAAAGGHHLLMVGPPGAGKTMLAERMPGILVPLDDDEALEVTTIHSAAGESLPSGGLVRTPPFRAPHHTVSHVALVGGGSRTLKPGEISLAHGTVSICTMTTRAAIYVRISRDPGSDRLGVQRQREACEALCDRNGWTVAQVYEDNDLSAYSGKKRPQYDAMLDDLAAGSIDALVAWAPDRFTRSTRELEDLIDAVEKAKAEVSTVQAGPYDLGTPAGRMSARVVGSVAKFESEHKSERLKAKHRELAQAGKVSGGGTRPFGFEDDRVTVRETEAQRIREMAQMILDGRSVHAVCKYLGREGVPTVTGKPWRPPVVRALLMSARIAGKREHFTKGPDGKRVSLGVTEAVWPAIIDDTTWHSLRAVLGDPDRTTRPGRPAQKLLSGGVAVCGRCGQPLYSDPRPNGPSYCCRKGPAFNGCALRIQGEPLDELVSAMVLEALRDVDLTYQVRTDSPPDIGPLGEKVATLEAELDALADDYADGKVGREAFTRASARIESRIMDARRAVSAAVPRPAVPADAAERWPDLSVDERREIIAAVIENVIVGPAVRGRNRFDEDRVSVVWRV